MGARRLQYTRIVRPYTANGRIPVVLQSPCSPLFPLIWVKGGEQTTRLGKNMLVHEAVRPSFRRCTSSRIFPECWVVVYRIWECYVVRNYETARTPSSFLRGKGTAATPRKEVVKSSITATNLVYWVDRDARVSVVSFIRPIGERAHQFLGQVQPLGRNTTYVVVLFLLLS